MSDAMPAALSTKVAGLPAGAWLAVAATGLGVAFVMRRSGSPAPTVAGADPGLDNTVAGAGNLLVGAPSSNPTGTAPYAGGYAVPTTNEEWATAAQTALFAKGYSALGVNLAVRKFLNGDALNTQESALIGVALAAVGPPPSAPPPPMTSTPLPGPVPPLPTPAPHPAPARPAHATVSHHPAPPTPHKTPAPAVHVVARGESLSLIARRVGHGMTWQKLYAANRGVVGKNPNLIRPGQRLVIPR